MPDGLLAAGSDCRHLSSRRGLGNDEELTEGRKGRGDDGSCCAVRCCAVAVMLLCCACETRAGGRARKNKALRFEAWPTGALGAFGSGPPRGHEDPARAQSAGALQGRAKESKARAGQAQAGQADSP